MKLEDLERWRGKRDEVAIDPTAVEFTARPCKSCFGCAFDTQSAKVCGIAASEAKKRGLPDCDENFVYQIVEKDPRQLAIAVD